MNFAIECELEDDGRWLAEAPQLPGVLAYGQLATRPWPRPKFLRFAYLLNDSSMARAGPSRYHFCRSRVTRWPSAKAR